ncbi:MAG: DUF1269 domain-containing protein [Chloroflexota bacterium]|jgi:uncharacterized membrane protein
MSEMLVFAFKTPTGANEMRDALVGLQKQEMIALADAAVVVRSDDGKVKVKQANNLVGAGAMGGAFWGMLIGLLFFAPWLGLAVGAITGAITGKLSDVGIDDSFIKEVGETIEPGHSALFLLINRWTEDKVMDSLKDFDAEVLRTNLSAEDEAKLKEVFGAHDEAEAAA